ncbi:MAG: dihydropteroate synthase [Candidatus Eremiobacteraeota bacterium]|jgi:dihydropteroate synthase|nr:dihydropteroate synthase [Candidatus Eremiobacteraeota bacterium]
MSDGFPSREAVVRAGRGALRVRDRVLAWGERTYVMGIVNVSPDSFSGDGDPHAGAAAARALRQLADGADIIDVGAESTRPGHRPIGDDTERARLLPAVAAIRAAAPDAIVSVDTFKDGVFRAARAAGGDVLNSIWGASDELIAACAQTGAPIVVMHNKAVAVYERDVVAEMLAFLEDAAARCVRGGIPAEHVILDPGIGFGKLPEHNIAVLRALDRLVALGFPTLIGTSRKSTIGKLTGRRVDAREFGTAATIALAIAAGIDVVRVHDVPEQCDVVRVSDAIVRGWRPNGWAERLP